MIRYLTFEIVRLPMHQRLLVKGARDKEKKEKTKKQTQHPLCSSHLNKGTEDVKEQKQKQKKNKNYKMIPAPCHPTHTLIQINHPAPIPSLCRDQGSNLGCCNHNTMY